MILMKELKLEVLQDGTTTGLSVRNGGFLAEAASVCLSSNNHGMATVFKVEGSFQETYYLSRLEVDEIIISSFGDLDEAVQFGAMGIAVILINDQTGWKAKRSWKGTGFDYWFGYDDELPFQNKLRVEVSGDLKGSDSELISRLSQKIKQTERSDNVLLPSCAVVVEFSNPKSLTSFR
jgi:hypothetical protein